MVSNHIFQKNNFIRKINGFKTLFFQKSTNHQVLPDRDSPDQTIASSTRSKMAIFESISANKTLSDTNTCLIKCLCLLVSHFATNPAISVFQFSPNSEGSFFKGSYT